MNERIRDLTFKAGAKLYSEPSTRAVTGVTMSFESVEKFAELIVRECADVLDKRIAPPNHPMNSLGYKLKQHFGVE